MKTLVKVSSVLLVSVAVILMLARAQPKQPGTLGSAKGPLIVWDPPDPAAWSEKGRQQVADAIAKIQSQINMIQAPGLSRETTVRRIANLHGRNGLLVGHNGETIRGDKEISDYFYRYLDRFKDLSFSIKVVYVKEYKDVINRQPAAPDDVIHSAFFIFSWDYQLGGKLKDPVSATNLIHVRMCEWSNGI